MNFGRISFLGGALFATAGFLISPSAFAVTGKLKGTIRVDGSSTVFPITEAVAEEFRKVQPRVRVTVGVSGTGGGFKKFLVGEIDINDASRSIKPSEVTKAKKNKLDYLEIPVAYDGISVVVNPKNTWAKTITTAELKKIWEPGSKVKTWKQIRSSWPDVPLKLFGPGTDSGTFDYFTQAINGKSHVSRSDFSKSEDDNVIVQGVMGEKGAMGYFGYAYYKENKAKIRALGIDSGKGAVMPTEKTINDGTYKPLARPVFIYVNRAKLSKVEVMAFVKFYIEQAGSLASDVGYISLPKSEYESALKKIGG